MGTSTCTRLLLAQLGKRHACFLCKKKLRTLLVKQIFCCIENKTLDERIRNRQCDLGCFFILNKMLRKTVNENRSSKVARVDNESCPLADKILHSYNLGDKALSDYVNSLDSQQVETLVQHFEHKSKLGTSLIVL
jgi:hypothetical protein